MSRDTVRVEAFSDAVIAVALTLMAVELLQFNPSGAADTDLVSRLQQEWRAFLAYIITFAIVGQIWLTHHNSWRYVVRVDQMLLVLNLIMLMFVAAIPFTANQLSDHLRGSDVDQQLSAAIYVGAVLGEALFFNLGWWWARSHGLLNPDLDPRLAASVSRRYLVRPLLYLLAFAIVFVNPILSLLAYLLLVAIYLVRGPGDLPPGGYEKSERGEPSGDHGPEN
ncbi:TMEM175 family protein [Salinispora tropica]|nr:TMEM175 family protein [Salinispora tropica]